jgi:hypothetical protein
VWHLRCRTFYGSATWRSPPTWNQRADGSLPGIRNRRLHLRLGDAVASRHYLWEGVGAGQGVIRRART